MKKTIMVFALVSFFMATSLFASDARTFCSEVRAEFSDLLEQLPMRTDAVTFMTGASALFQRSTNKCVITYHYLIEQEKILDFTVREADDKKHAKQWILGYYNTAEGLGALTSTIRTSLPAMILELAEPSDVTINLVYNFDLGGIPSFTITLD